MSAAELRKRFAGNKKYLRFINDMLRAGREVRSYSARGMEGAECPSVSCDRHELQAVMRETKESVEYDTLGKGYVVYVR
jgi:hypothetical protein